jgi:hypothetical protein
VKNFSENIVITCFEGQLILLTWFFLTSKTVHRCALGRRKDWSKGKWLLPRFQCLLMTPPNHLNRWNLHISLDLRQI